MSDSLPAFGHHDDGTSLLQGPFPVIEGLLRLVEVHIHRVRGYGDHDIRLLRHGDYEHLLTPFDGLIESGIEFSGSDLVDVLMAVHHDLDGEYLLPLDDLQGVHHILMDGVPLEFEGLCIHTDGHPVVGLDGGIGCHSGEEGLPSPGPSGEVVGFHRGYYNEPVGVDGYLVDLHRSTVLGRSEVHALGLLGIVDDDPVPELLEMGSEYVPVLLFGRTPVGTGGDKISGDTEVHPLGEGVEHLGRRGGTGTVVDDEDYVLPALEELVDRCSSDRCVEGFVDDLVGITADDVVGRIGPDVVLLRDLYLLYAVLAVLNVHYHFNLSRYPSFFFLNIWEEKTGVWHPYRYWI